MGIVGDDRAAVRVLVARNGGIREVCRLSADTERRGRVKGIVRCSESSQGIIFAIGMSLGRVEVWRLSPGVLPAAGAETRFSRLEVVDTGARLTCVTAWPGQAAAALARAAPAKTTEAVK